MNNFTFIDSQNLNLSIQDLGWKIDWKKLNQYLKDKYKVQKVFCLLGKLKRIKSYISF